MASPGAPFYPLDPRQIPGFEAGRSSFSFPLYFGNGKFAHFVQQYLEFRALQRSKDSSLWYRVIKAMFGDGGALDNTDKFARSSTWTTIVRECGNLSSKAIIPALPRESLEEEQFSKLIEDVNSVILSVSNDRWIWSLDSSGEFSIKSTRLFIDDHLLLAVGAPTRWVSEVPIKINIMAWKVSLDKLPTRLNLSLQGIEIPSITCPICTCAGESCSHLFFSCFMARNITTKLARWWEFDCPDLFSYDDWLEWFHTLHLLKGFKDILEGVFYVMWYVVPTGRVIATDSVIVATSGYVVPAAYDISPGRVKYVVPTGRVIATDSVIVATSGYVVPAAYDISPGRVK
ncbi:RNA-directed DNA polymerase, eukaryota [Tanacetum coccineum]